VKNKRYAGRQKGGPMKKLESRDWFEPTDGGTRWTNIVEYELPYSILGKRRRAPTTMWKRQRSS